MKTIINKSIVIIIKILYMPFIYYNGPEIIQGDITIIPPCYRSYAIMQQNNAIYAYHRGWFCPPMVVDIGKTIQFSVEKS